MPRLRLSNKPASRLISMSLNRGFNLTEAPLALYFMQCPDPGIECLDNEQPPIFVPLCRPARTSKTKNKKATQLATTRTLASSESPKG